jgi:uroporphyrinogen decarboxylase
MKPGAPIYQKEFGFYVLDRWKKEGHIDDDTDLAELFGYDEPGDYRLRGLGWTEAAFAPWFETKVLEDRGEYELVQDRAGRHLLCFKGRRSGFMPEFTAHPVTDARSWEENCKWRLDPQSPLRRAAVENAKKEALRSVKEGKVITQQAVGGYMYLRSLIGPADLPYMFYDNPDLIHDCMRTWLTLLDGVIAEYQKVVSIDIIALAEDICYNHGPLISPDMMREFLFPYYQQLLTNIKRRQLDKNRQLHFFVDTDGYAVPVIPLYRELGMDYMSPFEVASGCDVTEIGRLYPDLRISGGFDKRILAQGKEAIDREVDRIMPVMYERGGYIPTCDHGVPAEVNFASYMHYRQRMLEYS